jgi:CDP-glycerol glycerophosphotransferase
MLISWIVPYYDLEPWLLERCLRSILRASASCSYEVIVVDDGSIRYRPAEVVAQFPEAPIRLIRQANGGLSAARNAALEVARGDYLGFVDADDALADATLPLALDLLQREHPDLLVYECRKFHTRTLPDVTCSAPPLTRYPTAAQMMAERNLAGAAWLNLIRRDLQQRYQWRFPVGMLHEDGPFTTRLYYAAGQTLYLEAPVYLYYQRPGSIMNDTTPEHIERRLDHFCHYIRSVYRLSEEHAADATPLQRRALQRKLRLLAGDYLRAMLRLYYPLREIETRLAALRPMGLYPLRAADRGLKYRALAALGNHRLGILLLYAAEALMKYHSKL